MVRTTRQSKADKPAVGEHLERRAVLEWVAIPTMKVTPTAQRFENKSRVDYLIANMDLEKLDYPVVNLRGENAYIIDGQHRVAALRGWGAGDSQIECWVYRGLTEQQEADQFLSRNDQLTVATFDRFRIGVTAGRKAETTIQRLANEVGVKIAREDSPGAISAVGTLVRIYARGGEDVLARTLVICRDVFGVSGRIPALMLDGVALVVGRYGDLNDAHLTNRLRRFTNGAAGLANKAEIVRQTTGQPKGQCLASEIVKLYNAGSRHPEGGRLMPWWKAEAQADRLEQTA